MTRDSRVDRDRDVTGFADQCDDLLAAIGARCERLHADLDRIGTELSGPEPDASDVESAAASLLDTAWSVRQRTFEALHWELSKLLAAHPDRGGEKLTPTAAERHLGELRAHHDRLVNAVTPLVESASTDTTDPATPLKCVDDARTAVRRIDSTATLLQCRLAVGAARSADRRRPDGGVRRDESEVADREDAYVVQGRVSHSGRTGDAEESLAGLTVRAYDRDLRGYEELGTATTDESGQYRITFARPSFAADEQEEPDLELRVYNAIGTRLAVSGTRYNADQRARIDIELPEGVSVEPTEYARLRHDLTTVADGVSAGDLSETDIAFLERELDLEGRTAYPAGTSTLRIYVEAITRSIDLPAEVNLLYGLARKDLSLAPEELAATDLETLRESLEAAIADGIVRDWSGREEAVEALHRSLARRQERADWQPRRATVRIRTDAGGARAGHRIVLRDPTDGRTVATGITDETGRIGTEIPMPASRDRDGDAARDLLVTVVNPLGEPISSERHTVTASEETSLSIPDSSGGREDIPIGDLDLDSEHSLSETTRDALAGVTLADVRSAGGLDGLDVPLAATDPEGRLIEDLSRLALTTGLDTAAWLSAQGYGDPSAIASESLAAFTRSLGDAVDRRAAIRIHLTAQIQTALLADLSVTRRAALANGLLESDFDIGGDG